MVDLHVGGDGLIADGDGDVAALGRDDRAPLLAPRILAFYRDLTEWGATGACYFGENMIFYCDSKEIDFSLQGERL